MMNLRATFAARCRAGATLALLALAACAPASPGPSDGRADQPVAANVAAHVAGDAAAIERTTTPVGRSGGRTAAPDFAGLDTGAIADLARDAGVAVQVMAFEQDATVTAQDPPPGSPVPPGGTVVLWLGTPPRPAPPPPPATPPSVPAASQTPETPAPEQTVTTVVEAALRVPAEAAPRPPADDAGPDTAPVTAPDVSIRDREPAPVGLVLTGRASWYGEELAGSPVACGGRFDPAAATLASRELRCGTRVQITGPTGATAEAVVTDWGPAEWTGKRFDLSRAVFEQLAPASRGWLEVEVEVIES